MRFFTTACILALVVLSLSAAAPFAQPEPSTGFDADDPVVRALAVRPVDQEECNRDSDCEDWCKEQSSTACVCRCGDWIPRADSTCEIYNEDEKKYCQRQVRAEHVSCPIVRVSQRGRSDLMMYVALAAKPLLGWVLQRNGEAAQEEVQEARRDAYRCHGAQLRALPRF
jgi:hypothetical protein